MEEQTSVQKDRTGDIRQFVGTFTAVSTRLRRMEILSEYQEIQLFHGRLHLNLTRTLVTNFKLDVNALESFWGTFDLIRREAQDYCSGAIRTEDLIQSVEFSWQGLIEQIFEQCVELARPVLLVPAERAQPQQQVLPTQISAHEPSREIAIDDISRRMEAMALRQ
jgi:hypothetical protein